MTGGRVVLCVRGSAGAGARSLLERMRALDARASARGGVLVAWGASRASFAFEPDAVADAVALLATPGDDTAPGEPPFAAGLAEGELDLLAEDGSRGELAWGAALAVASALASAARPGEIACTDDLSAMMSGRLVSAGRVRVRAGGTVVRGVRVPAAQPWREHAAMQLSRMRVPRLVGVDVTRLAADAAAGALTVVRAAPGAGGTRVLQEIASLAPRALFVAPSGSGYEPFGGLRRALARAIGPEIAPAFAPMSDALERLLAGRGVDLAAATALVRAFFSGAGASGATARQDVRTAVLLVDDVKLLDHATVDACVRATRGDASHAPSFAMIARLDRTSGLSTVLATLPRRTEIELDALSSELGEAVAAAATSGALEPAARQRWAKRGGGVPLAIVEAVAFGVASGLVLWRGERASGASHAAGRGAPRSAADWVRARASLLGDPARKVAATVALLGGEAQLARVSRVLTRAGESLPVERAVEELVRERWLVDSQEDWVELPSRTHRETLVALLDPADARALHAAAADVVGAEERAFGRAEAAWHAAQAGDGARAAHLLLDVARVTSAARLETSTTHLVSFARRVDPTCEEAALEILSDALARTASSPAARTTTGTTASEKLRAAVTAGGDRDSEPPTKANATAPHVAPAELPASAAPPSAGGTEIAQRLGDLAKAALVGADNARLEKWVDGLRASGDKPVLTERLRAMARLGRGDIGDALRVLRRTRQALGPEDHALRCQTSLALGVALSVAGRTDEALLEGLDALARARQAEDVDGARACLAFLAKLYASVGRPDDAARLNARR